MIYNLRKSQKEAISQTVDYFLTTQKTQPEYLWNAVMRWGKCLTSLNFIYNFNHDPRTPEDKKIKNALILTFFPATEDSWKRLFKGGVEEQDHFTNEFNFISVNSGKPAKDKVNVFFTSYQEIYNGKTKKNIFYQQYYDLIILDEYHYGSYKGKAKNNLKQTTGLTDQDLLARDSYKKLSYKYRLALTGTPYKDLIKSEFTTNNTFRFNYFDEQKDKLSNGAASDYKDCPTLKLYSVNIKKDNLTTEDKINFLFKNTELFGDKTTNPLFQLDKNGASFWLVPSVKEGKDIEKYLKTNYPNFNVINLCNTSKDSLKFARNGLENNQGKKSIILSYNKLTLGVTIPEIENVVFLREISTAELYMQAGCRAKSQYSDKSKDYAYLISFDIDNDYNIFQQITSNDITEKDFLKLLPIDFVDYDPKANTAVIKPVSDKTSFLDALAEVPLHEVIRKSVSKRIITNMDIPDDILEALNKISGIGNKRDILTPTTKKGIKERKENPIKAAEKEGHIQGNEDRDNGKLQICPIKYPDQPSIQAAFEKGYKKGFNEVDDSVEPVTSIEKEEAKSLSEIIRKIQLLIERFLYIIIGDYYRENKFLDIDDPSNVPEEFFSSLLGFEKDMFIRLYKDFIIDNDYINMVINTFKSRENRNTSYLGLPDEDDYEFIDLDELSDSDITKKREESISNIIDNFSNIVDIDDLEEDLEKDADLGTKYIYIAEPSQFLKDLIQMLNTLKSFLNRNSDIYDKVCKYLNEFKDSALGVKIGETHREPNIRCDELNGYTDKHILYDIYKYEKVDQSKSDIEFHKILEEVGYTRINAGSRRERFNISPDKAYDLLLSYIKPKSKTDDSQQPENNNWSMTWEEYAEFMEYKKFKEARSRVDSNKNNSNITDVIDTLFKNKKDDDDRDDLK